jgi:hypothetical protein
MIYKNLSDLAAAYRRRALNKEHDIVCVDNDSITLYVCSPNDEYGEDAECVFRFDGCPGELLIEALKLLGIPAEYA